jgi:DNA-binding winged helix-turn-helix (wHTH) protein/tetratricopeptide (TPR) repeat protein
VATSPEPIHTEQPSLVCFGEFKVDLQSGVLTRNGTKNRLQGQPLQLLELLLQQPGQIVTRDHIRHHLWPNGTVVEFEHSVNAAVKRLRAALDDDADKPTFIETIPRRGYRFIARIENGAPSPSATVEKDVAPDQTSAIAAPSRNKRRLVVAAVAAILLVGALAVWRLRSAGPKLTEDDVILLATFVNKTRDGVFDNSLDKALEIKLSESAFLSLLPEADARSTMRTMRHDPNEPVTRDIGIEICKRLGLKAVVVPEISNFGGKYLITLEAIDARNQKPIARRQAEAGSKDKVIAALGKAASQLRTQLGESLSSLEKYDAPLDLATTSSLEALQAYRTGQTLYRSGKRREAVTFFERAVELDPQFCSAYNMLGSAYHSLGDTQTSSENFARAFELKDRRLTQEENFQTTALYYSSITGNLEKETVVLVLYKQAYPRRASVHNLLGIAYAQQGRTEEALQEFHWAIDDSPVPSAQFNSNASQALVILGRFDEAKKMLDQWRQKSFFTPFQRDLRYRIAFFENDTPTMDRLARESAPDDISWLHLQMEFAFLRGDFGRIRSLSETLVKQQSHSNRVENVAYEFAWHGVLESDIGKYALARKLCRQAEEVGNDSPSGLSVCAKALADADELPGATALASKLDRLFPDDTYRQKVYLPIIFSIIERKRGNTVKAIDLLTPITQYPNVLVFYYRAQAYLAAGEPAKAVDEFKTVIAHRGWPEWPIFAPLAHLGLARAYAVQGNIESSRKAYDDFFTTWKEADPDIPILRQAKAEYKKLPATVSAADSAPRRDLALAR